MKDNSDNKSIIRKMSKKQIMKELDELEKLGVIEIDSQGNISRTQFGQQVYDHMREKKML